MLEFQHKANLEAQPPATLHEAEAWIDQAVREHGFRYFTYVGGQVYSFSARGVTKFVRQPVVLTTLPEEWISLYHAKNFGTIDPVVTEIQERRLPASWDMERRTDDAKSIIGAFVRAAHDFNVCRGYTVPMFGPEGDYGLISFVSDLKDNEFRSVVEEQSASLFMLAHQVHQMMRRFEHVEEAELTLTPREREVLQWTAAGKTGAEIAIIMSVAEKTVEYHMYKAMRKLDVYSRPQAICKALVMGLILPQIL